MFKVTIVHNELWVNNADDVTEIARLVQKSHINRSDPGETTDEAESESVIITME